MKVVPELPSNLAKKKFTLSLQFVSEIAQEMVDVSTSARALKLKSNNVLSMEIIPFYGLKIVETTLLEPPLMVKTPRALVFKDSLD